MATTDLIRIVFHGKMNNFEISCLIQLNATTTQLNEMSIQSNDSSAFALLNCNEYYLKDAMIHVFCCKNCSVLRCDI